MSRKASFVTKIVCSINTLILLASLGTPAMGQGQGGAYVVWNPLWPTPQYDRMEWTLNVLNLPIQDSYYFWALQDGFVGGGAFYFGLQPYGECPGGGNCQMALFSFFGTGSTTSSPNCQSGADGGPGMSCHIEYSWSTRVPYRFAIQLSGTDPINNTETWTGTVTNALTGIVTEIGNWTVPEQTPGTPLGLIGTEAVSFVEYYESPGSCQNEPYAEVTMSVPTGYYEGTPYQGGVNSYFPTQDCPKSAKFQLYPNGTSPIGVKVKTGMRKK